MTFFSKLRNIAEAEVGLGNKSRSGEIEQSLRSSSNHDVRGGDLVVFNNVILFFDIQLSQVLLIFEEFP